MSLGSLHFGLARPAAQSANAGTASWMEPASCA